MRIVLGGFIIILLVLSCGLAVRYNQDASYAIDELDGERYKRMVAEENLKKANQQVSGLSAEKKRLQSKIEDIEMVLEKTMSLNSDYKNRLDQA